MHKGFSHYYFCKQCIYAAFLMHGINFQTKNHEIQLRRKLSLKQLDHNLSIQNMTNTQINRF